MSRAGRIYAIDLLAIDYPRLDLEVRCGKGTYIRSLARDLGERLGCGGYIVHLRRTRVGSFQVENGIGLDCDRETARGRLLPLDAAVTDLPRVELEARVATHFCSGGVVSLPNDCGTTGLVAVFGDVKLLGIGEANREESRFARGRSWFKFLDRKDRPAGSKVPRSAAGPRVVRGLSRTIPSRSGGLTR